MQISREISFHIFFFYALSQIFCYNTNPLSFSYFFITEQKSFPSFVFCSRRSNVLLIYQRSSCCMFISIVSLTFLFLYLKLNLRFEKRWKRICALSNFISHFRFYAFRAFFYKLKE